MKQDAIEGLEIWVFKGKQEGKKMKTKIPSVSLKIGPQGMQSMCQETLF